MPTTLTLKFGSSGSAVLDLQNALIAQGILPKLASDGSANDDGKFGYITQSAVKQFQKSSGLAVDGIVGQATRTALGLTPSAPVVAAKSATHVFTESQRLRLAEKIDGLIPTGPLDWFDDTLFLWAINRIDEVLAANLPQPLVDMLHDLNKGLPNTQVIRQRLAQVLNQNINIPFFDESTEQNIFNYIVDLLANAMGWGSRLDAELDK